MGWFLAFHKHLFWLVAMRFSIELAKIINNFSLLLCRRACHHAFLCFNISSNLYEVLIDLSECGLQQSQKHYKFMSASMFSVPLGREYLIYLNKWRDYFVWKCCTVVYGYWWVYVRMFFKYFWKCENTKIVYCFSLI